ncbi:MAG: hypothetical protein KC731_38725, partial [Myxococcales bacterium]|nr:hypothetical protein [Myxococcales bacterium]
LFRGMTAAPAEVPLLDALLARADRMGLGSLAATVPFVLADRGRQGFQSLLRTPVHGLPFTRVSPMLYTSMVEGYSRGALARADVLALLGWAARHHRERLGGRASVSLGVVGHGILGDEPRYRGPRELAADVAIALHAGIDHLALFSLGGILDRPPVEAWLDAFCQPIPPQTTPRPSATLRAALATAATLAASRALALAAERAPIDGS